MTSQLSAMPWVPEAGPPMPAGTPRLSATAPAAAHVVNGSSLGTPPTPATPVAAPQAPPASLATLSVPALHASRSAGRISGGRPAAFPTSGVYMEPAVGVAGTAADSAGSRQSQGSGHSGSRPDSADGKGGEPASTSDSTSLLRGRLLLGLNFAVWARWDF